jgi:hypothetical protein
MSRLFGLIVPLMALAAAGCGSTAISSTPAASSSLQASVDLAGLQMVQVSGFAGGHPVVCQVAAASGHLSLQGGSRIPVGWSVDISVGSGYHGDGTYAVGQSAGASSTATASAEVMIIAPSPSPTPRATASPSPSERVVATPPVIAAPSGLIQLSQGLVVVGANGHDLTFQGQASNASGIDGVVSGSASC